MLAVAAAFGQRAQHAYRSRTITRLPPEQPQALLTCGGVGQQATVEHAGEQLGALPGLIRSAGEQHQAVQFRLAEAQALAVRRTQGRQRLVVAAGHLLQTGQLAPALGIVRLARQQLTLPALGLGIALEVGVGAHQKLQPDVIGIGIGLHVTLGQRQRLGRLVHALIGLHQHLQHLLGGAGLIRRQQLDDLGVAALAQVELGQVEAFAGEHLFVELAAAHGLVQPVDGLAVVASRPGHVGLAAPDQCLFEAAALGLDVIQHTSCGGIVALLLRNLRRVQGLEHGRVDGLLGHARHGHSTEHHEQQPTVHGQLLSRRK